MDVVNVVFLRLSVITILNAKLSTNRHLITRDMQRYLSAGIFQPIPEVRVSVFKASSNEGGSEIQRVKLSQPHK